MDMKLSDRQKSTIADLFAKKRACSECGGRDWRIEDYLVSLPVGPALCLPSVAFHCNDCYHVVLFSAVRLGVVDNKGRMVEPEAQAKKPRLQLVKEES